MKRLLTSLAVIAAACLPVLAGCNPTTAAPPKTPGETEEPPTGDGIRYETYDVSSVTFQDNHDAELANYNSDLYYLNDWKLGYNASNAKGDYNPDMGDPMIVYDNGYYYAFGTRGATSFHCFRSKDMTHWERLADAFVPEQNSWSKTNLWAPDIQKIDGKWYLYYTASMIYEDKAEHCHIGVAVSDNVYGPYKQFTGKNGDGEEITLKQTPFTGLDRHTILDQTVFIDDDGEMYMYFSYETKTGTQEHIDMSKNGIVSEIWGVKMKDAVTWDLSTLTPLISPGYKKYSDEKRTIDWETWSPSFRGGMQCCEGPYMIKHGGKYFLTYCANSFIDAEYAVGYAVSTDPLGKNDEFVKPDGTYLENMLLGVPSAPGTYLSNRYKGFTRGTGHAAIFKTGAGDDYMFAYHAHFNREKWDNNNPPDNYRALAVDYLYFDENGNPYTNGPTYSLQRTPSDVSGNTNLMKNATVRAEGEHAEYLKDNYTNRAVGTEEVIKESTFKAGTRSIEIKLEKQAEIAAINVYNSCDYTKSIYTITQIDFGGGMGIVNARFNRRYVKDDFIFPHSAFNIELARGVVTDRIVITISNLDYDFALGEIEIIGKYKE